MSDQVNNPSPEEIERDIERTRADMSTTIEAIQTKLTPKQLANQAVDYALATKPGMYGTNIVNTVREKPLPIAMIGIGLAMLMRNTRQSSQDTYTTRRTVSTAAYYPEDELGYDVSTAGYVDGESSSDGLLQRAKSKTSDAASNIKGKASQAGQRLSDTASQVSLRAREARERARSKFQESAEQARYRMNELGQRSQMQYYRAKDQFDRVRDEQPLVVGALGIALGAALGAAVPVSRRENELMGRTRDDLVNRATETARQQAETLKQSAQRVAQTAKESAKQEADQLKGNVAGSQSQSIPPGNANNTQFSGSNFPS